MRKRHPFLPCQILSRFWITSLTYSAEAACLHGDPAAGMLVLEAIIFLAKRFHVSTAALSNRLSNLGMLR